MCELCEHCEIRIKIVERWKGWKKIQLGGSELNRLTFLKSSSTETRIHFGESELWSNKYRVSFVVCLTTCALFYLYFRFDLLWGVVSVFVGTWNILDITYRSTTPSCICARARGGVYSDICAGSEVDWSLQPVWPVGCSLPDRSVCWHFKFCNLQNL